MLTIAEKLPADAPARGPLAPFCWQGWQTALPAAWDLVKLDGDHRAGHAVFTERHVPRLVLRWTSGVRGDRADEWVDRTLRKELGPNAGRPGPRRFDPRWPAADTRRDSEREMWAGYSPASKRALVITRHGPPDSGVPPVVTDTPAGDPTPWAVFSLCCRIPPEFALCRHTLNAGDLALDFMARGPTRLLSIRQVSPARLALERSILDDWLDRYQASFRPRYEPAGEARPVTVQPGLAGLARRLVKSRRFFFAVRLPRELITYALHDVARDRIVFVQGTSEDLVRDVAPTVGQPPEVPV